ncbi:MAG TPA: SH3 domain-containing protein [Candidatus Solibacter sp.]|nr:SH3 domain-containing protein [Candidatus Solibacter sp.]
MRHSPRMDFSALSGRCFRLAALVLSAAILTILNGCSGGSADKSEYAYVASPEAVLRDRVAAVYSKTGVLHNGERVQVLERLANRRFVRVRSTRGEEGWIQERYLTDQQTFEQLQRLSEQFKSAPAQAVGVARAQLNLHAIPGRKTEHLYQLNENEKVDMLERQVVDRNSSGAAAPPKSDDKSQKEAETEPNAEEQSGPGGKANQPPVLEDWWLIRDSQKRVGWVLGRLLYVDIPMDIAQYAEGQRIVAFFVLDEAQDGDKKVAEYLVMMSESKDGLPYDYDHVRVFTWNVRRHRYETAYRERNIAGFLPVTLGKEDFGAREGTLRTFTLRLQDQSGTLHEQKYKFNPPIVRQVVAPGQEPLKMHHKPGPHRAKRRHSR